MVKADRSIPRKPGFLHEHDGNTVDDRVDAAAIDALDAGVVRKLPDRRATGGAANDLDETWVERHEKPPGRARYTPIGAAAPRSASILRPMLSFPAALGEAIDARGSGLVILILRLGAMGDIVRTLPAVRLVRSGLPEARIHWVAWEPWTLILEGHRDIDGVVGLSRSTLRARLRSPHAWPSLAGALAALVSQLRAPRAGIALDFHGDFRTGLLGWISGAPVRLGYAGHQQKEGNSVFTTHRVPSGPRRTE